MKFCSQCGQPVEHRIPEGDNMLRHVCDACGTIHYQNPKVVVGCIPEWDDQILLCKRAIEPRYGAWTLPAGFMENNETTFEAACRETLEEAGARVAEPSLYTIFSLPHINQVYMMYRAQLADLDFAPGTESLEVALHNESNIPWNQLAFPVIAETLRLYCEDRAAGEFGFYTGDIWRETAGGTAYRVRMLGQEEALLVNNDDK